MTNRLTNFFARPDINVGRQKNIDYAKAFSILFMIFIHTLMFPEYFGLQTTIVGRIADMYLGGFMAAPVFMSAMGVGLAFTRHSKPNQIIKRGAKFFAGSFLFNIARDFSLIIYSLAARREVFVTTWPYIFFTGDILGFVGLSLMLFGLLKKLKHHEIIIPSLALIFTIIVTAVPQVYSDNYAISLTLGYFFPIGGGDFGINVNFPLMSWFIYVAFGYTFARIMRKVKNLDYFYLWCAIIGVFCLIPIVATEVVFNYGQMAKDASDLQIYMVILPDAVMAIGFVLFDFAFFHCICKLTSEKVNKFFHMIANAINEIYVISWILIMNVSYMILSYLVAKEEYKLWVYMIVFLITMLISYPLGILWKKIKSNHQQLKTNQSKILLKTKKNKK